MLLGAANFGCSEDPTRPPNCPPWNPFLTTASFPTWSPDSRFVGFLGSRDSLGRFAPGIYVVDTLGSLPTKILDLDGSGIPRYLDWSPDGSRMAFIYFNELWTLNLADRTSRQWTFSGYYPHEPSWSPDGRFIAFGYSSVPYNVPDTASGLHVLDTFDGTERAILHSDTLPTYGGHPSWSGDGRTLVFSVAEARHSNLYTLRLDGTQHRRITNLTGYPANPQWAPDRGRIFFDFTPPPCFPSADRTTWLVAPDGTALARWPVNLGDPRVQLGFPFALSRDGQRVAFVGLDTTGTYGVIWMMRIDGSDRRQLSSF